MYISSILLGIFHANRFARCIGDTLLRSVVQSDRPKWDDPNEYERRFRWVRSRNNASFDLHTVSRRKSLHLFFVTTFSFCSFYTFRYVAGKMWLFKSADNATSPLILTHLYVILSNGTHRVNFFIDLHDATNIVKTPTQCN